MNASSSDHMSDIPAELKCLFAQGLEHPHAIEAEELFTLLESTKHGLESEEAAHRLQQWGPNAMPQPKLPGVIKVFFQAVCRPINSSEIK